MREQDFRAYMRTLTSPQGTPLREGNMDFYATACINIENAENRNLDEEFEQDILFFFFFFNIIEKIKNITAPIQQIYQSIMQYEKLYQTTEAH